jgi:hypothetical protein
MLLLHTLPLLNRYILLNCLPEQDKNPFRLWQGAYKVFLTIPHFFRRWSALGPTAPLKIGRWPGRKIMGKTEKALN